MKQRSTCRTILSLAAYIILALVVAYIITHNYPPSLAVGIQAPLDNKLTNLNGSALGLNNFKRPLLINFWATWCTPCQQELPILSRAAKKYANQITFIGAAVDSAHADIISTKNNLGLDYIISEASPHVVKTWHAELLPTTYLVDTKGTIVWAHAGLLSEEELQKALDLVLK